MQQNQNGSQSQAGMQQPPHYDPSGNVPQFGAMEQNSPAPPKVETVHVPKYTTSDIQKAMESTEFFRLQDSVEKIRGKSLNHNDLNLLYHIYDYIELPVEVIHILVSYCVHKQKIGRANKNYSSMRYVKTEAEVWLRQGIATGEVAYAFTDRILRMTPQEQEVAQIFQMYHLDFFSEHYDFLEQWNKWGFPLESYPLAYEATMEGLARKNTDSSKKVNFNWKYCNGIFYNWHKANVHSPFEIKDYQNQYKNQNKRNAPRHGTQARSGASRGPSAHDTMIGNATTPPPEEQAKGMQENFDIAKKILEQYKK